MLTKATDLPADEVFLDLEDSVSPLAKDEARRAVIGALQAGGFTAGVVAVRVNDVTTPWAYRDVIDVVEQAGDHLDALILPKVSAPDHVHWCDLLLSQLESGLGLAPGRILIEVQIEDAAGLAAVDSIAAASGRIAAIAFGPADFMASINMRSLVVGQQPPGYREGDAYHYPLSRILIAARAHGCQAIDGPYLQVRDNEGLRHVAERSAALGFDGKWVLHPEQIDTVNQIFAPDQGDYDRACLILEAYEYHTSAAGGRRGAVMLGAEMIDEASRKMARVIAGKGQAAGLVRTVPFTPPVTGES